MHITRFIHRSEYAAMSTPLFVDYNSAGYSIEELDRQYNARAAVPDSAHLIAQYAQASAQVRAQFGVHTGEPYGPHPDETLDIFPAAQPGAPVFVFIHGGYWRALSSSDSHFVTPAFLKAGATVVVVNYALAPAVSLDQITLQCRRALAWVHRHVARFNGDPARIHVCGHSAGGQLTGMLLAPDWPLQFGVSQPLLHSASAISGLFDLRPLMHTHINDWLNLTPQSAQANSPVFHVPSQPCPVVLACGGLETAEFRRQSLLYGQALQARGGQVDLLFPPQTNHFSVLFQLADPASSLFKAIARLMAL